MKVSALIILALGFLGASSVWLYLGCQGVCFVRMADYRVSVPDRPRASGALYSLDRGDYLLVLGDGSLRHCEAYYVESDRRAIGVPNFDRSKYTPRPNGAFVDKLVFEKYPVIGTLAAEWRVGERETVIRITGRPPEVERADPIDDPEEFYQQWMPVAYKTEIVLTKTRHVQ
jgi:hypothetical protein